MKYVDSKLLQKAEGRKQGKYLLTVEITDYDIEQFEDFGSFPTCWVKRYENEPNKIDVVVNDEQKNTYLRNLFHKVFQKLWRKYDD